LNSPIPFFSCSCGVFLTRLLGTRFGCFSLLIPERGLSFCHRTILPLSETRSGRPRPAFDPTPGDHLIIPVPLILQLPHGLPSHLPPTPAHFEGLDVLVFPCLETSPFAILFTPFSKPLHTFTPLPLDLSNLCCALRLTVIRCRSFFPTSPNKPHIRTSNSCALLRPQNSNRHTEHCRCVALSPHHVISGST